MCRYMWQCTSTIANAQLSMKALGSTQKNLICMSLSRLACLWLCAFALVCCYKYSAVHFSCFHCQNGYGGFVLQTLSLNWLVFNLTDASYDYLDNRSLRLSRSSIFTPASHSNDITPTLLDLFFGCFFSLQFVGNQMVISRKMLLSRTLKPYCRSKSINEVHFFEKSRIRKNGMEFFGTSEECSDSAWFVGICQFPLWLFRINLWDSHFTRVWTLVSKKLIIRVPDSRFKILQSRTSLSRWQTRCHCILYSYSSCLNEDFHHAATFVVSIVSLLHTDSIFSIIFADKPHNS